MPSRMKLIWFFFLSRLKYHQEDNMFNETKPNDTNYIFDYVEHFKKVQLVPYSIVMAVGFFANLRIFSGSFRLRHVTWHNSNYFALSFAFACLGVCTVTIPIEIYENTVKPLKLTEFTCKYVVQMQETFQGATLFSISLLAIFRAYQVKFSPTKLCSRRICIALLTGLWIICFCIFTVPTFFIFKLHSQGFCEAVFKDETFKVLFLSIVIVIMVVPILSSTIAYGYVVIKIARNSTYCMQISKLGNRKMTALLILQILSCWISYTPNIVYFTLSVHTNVKFDKLYAWSIANVFFLTGSGMNLVLILLSMPLEYNIPISVAPKQSRQIVYLEKQSLNETNV